MSEINLPSDSNHVSLPSGVTVRPSGQGATRITVRDGVVKEERIAPLQFKPSQDRPTGIMGGRNNNSGMPITDLSQINPKNTIFEIGGLQMTVENMLHLGKLVRNDQGGYELPQRGELNAPANAEAPAQEPSVNILSKDAVAALDEISALTHSEASTNAMVAPVMSHLAAGDLDGAVAAVVRSCGMEPSRAAEIVSGMAEDIRGRVAAHLTARHGIDGADAVAFLDTLPAGLRVSLAHRAFLGDRSVYGEIEAKYRHAKRIATTIATPGWQSAR